MSFGTRVPSMIDLLASPAGRPLPPRQQPGRSQPTMRPSGGTDVEVRPDRRVDGLPVALAVAELPDFNRKG
ncbi:MAG: hypothetical protein ACRDTC_15920 [Pseudonocardiaceae bacterium]